MSSTKSRRRPAVYKFLIALVPVLAALILGSREARATCSSCNAALQGAAMMQAIVKYFASGFEALDTYYDKATLSPNTMPAQLQAQIINYQQPSPSLGSVGHLGMYVGGGLPDQAGWGADGGGAVLQSSGLRPSDTAGLLTPGETMNVHDVSGYGGIFGTFDASRFVGSNQSLLLTGFFNYQSDSAGMGGVSPTGVAFPIGSLHTDTYSLGASLFYSTGTTYLRGAAAYNFGHSNEAMSLGGVSTGSFNSNGYWVDAKLGNVFVLLNTTGVSASAPLPTKAPAKPSGGALVGLDLSGHIGSFGNWTNGFTDSTGFIFGTDQTRSGDIGGRAELFALMPGNGLLWKPYVAGTVDQLFGFSGTLTIPNQAALPGGDLFSVQPAQTFGGAELGVVGYGRGGWSVGVKGFYLASADTNIAGGSVTVKIPFNYMPTVGPRY